MKWNSNKDHQNRKAGKEIKDQQHMALLHNVLIWFKKNPLTYESFGKLNPAKSVGVRLFLVFIVATMFFVLSLGILSYELAKNTIQNNAKTANRETLTQTSDKLDMIMQRYQYGYQQVFYDQGLQKNINKLSSKNASQYDHFVTTQAIEQQLSSFLYSVQGARSIYLFPLTQTYMPITGGSADTNFIAALQSESWYKTVEDTDSVEWSTSEQGDMIRFAQSIKAMDTTDRFILVMDIDLKTISDQLAKVSLGDGSKVQLIQPVSGNNEIIASNNDSEYGQTMDYQLSDQKNSDSLIIKNKSGKSTLIVYNTMQSSGWKLIGVVPVSNLVKDAQKILITTFISAVVVAIIAVIIGLWMVRMVARPLSRMNKLMLEGASGNLSVRMNHSGQDEIGQLAVGFNSMMEQITELVGQANESASSVLGTATELADASKKTALAAKEIAVATEEIANGAGSLATESERGSELTEHIGIQVTAVIASNHEMQESAKQVELASEKGGQHLRELKVKTNSTGEMTRALVERVHTLHASTASVMKVLDVMQNITQQTNILSLNATIEAARAGAAGRGFMVVADEIRQLAEQSKQSIAMVGQITDQIQGEMNNTIKVLEEVNPMFEKQIASVEETVNIFVTVQEEMNLFISKLGSVTTSIEGLNQSQNILAEAMTNVSAVAEESSATSEEVASLSSEQETIGNQLVQLSSKLEMVSDNLKESLAKFTI